MLPSSPRFLAVGPCTAGQATPARFMRGHQTGRGPDIDGFAPASQLSCGRLPLLVVRGHEFRLSAVYDLIPVPGTTALFTCSVQHSRTCPLSLSFEYVLDLGFVASSSHEGHWRLRSEKLLAIDQTYILAN